MSTIDQRVVEMRFDNRQFEQNVQTSLGTLDKLKQSLNLSGAAKGLESVGAAAKGIDMSPIATGVESVRSRFSALEVMAVTALANITNSAVNAGKRFAAAFTIEPVKTGLQEYETQINAIQTVLANTSSKGTTLEDVNQALDTLNQYADKTIYNFTEMTRNIGTFTAAGIELDTATNAIQGIANLAAVSGSSSQQASTAMYQLSQALASGTVKLMDWNSVVNAGMGGQVFQDALKKTSKELGTGAEAAIKANGSFRESLQTGWLTSEVLTETLKKFTTSGANEYVAEYTGLTANAVQAALDAAEAQYGEAEAVDKAAEALAKKSGKNKDEIKQALQFAKTAEDAATKVKTFSQLMDTLKEAVQSGWTQTWEILIGDFEQAKELWTTASDFFGEAINNASKARNEMLQAWADAGGRDKAIQAVKDAFQGLLNILKPIKDAFSEVFPAMTSERLLKITDTIADLAARFKAATENTDKLKSTFKGVFSIIDIGMTVISELIGGAAKLLGSLSGLGGGILGITATFGDWVSGLRDSIKETDVFGNAIDKVVGFLQNGIEKIKEFFGFVGEKVSAPGFEWFLGVMERIWDVIKNIGSRIVDLGKNIGDSISDAFRSGDIERGLDVFNTSVFATILLGIKNFVGGLTDAFEDTGDVIGNIKGILDDVRGSFEAYQQNLKAGTLMKIAGAIGILAASLTVLSLIDPERLSNAMVAITVLFGELIGALALFNKIDGVYKNAIKATGLMVGISVSVLILSGALKRIADLDMDQIGKGLLGIGGLALIVVGAAAAMSKMQGKAMKGALNIVIFASAIKILASACEDMSAMTLEEIGKGLLGVGVLMAEVLLFLNNAKFSGKAVSTAVGVTILAGAIKILASACSDFGAMDLGAINQSLFAIGALLSEIAIFTNLTGNAKNVISTGAALVLIGASMKIFASAVSDFATMGWDELGRGLIGMAGALTAVTIAVNLMPSNMIGVGVGLLAVSGALMILSQTLTVMGGMSWAEIGKSMVALGGSMLILATGLNFMNGTLAGSAALLVASAALAVLAPVLERLGAMSLGEIVKSLITVAGVFAVFGVAGAVLTPLVPTLLGLSGALALIGVATLGIGVGLAAAATGLTALATAGTAGAAAIVAALTIIITGVVGLIPTIAQSIGNAIIVFCQTITAAAPVIGETIKTLVLTLIDVLVTCGPVLINGLMTILLQLLTALDVYLPIFVEKAVSIAVGFIEGMCRGLAENMPRIVDAILGLGKAVLDTILGLFGIHSPSSVFLDIGKNLILGLINGVKGMVSEAVKVVVNLGAKLISTIARKASEFLAKGKELITRLTTGIKSKASAAKESVKDIASKAVSAIKEKLSDFKNAGKELLNGFVQGIKSKVQAAKDAASSIGKSALNSIKSFLGIASPSKEFIEIGEYCGEGLAKGLGDEGGAAIAAGEELGDSVMQAINKALAEDEAAGIGRSVSKSVAQGITSDKSAEKAATLKAQDIASSFSTALSAIELDRKTLNLEHQLWGYTDGVDASDTERQIREADKVNKELELQTERVQIAEEEYRVTMAQFGETATETQEAYNKLLEEKIKTAELAAQADRAIAAEFEANMQAMKAYANWMNANSSILLGRGFSMSEIESFGRGETGFYGEVFDVEGSKDAAEYWATSTYEEIKKQCQDISYDSWKQIAKSASAGLITGTSGVSTDLTKTATKMASSISNAAKKELGIHSPSKVFYEIGRNVIAGFSNALTDGKNEVQRSAINGFGSAVSLIMNAFDSNIETQPTIRPVLDLTNVQNGASRLNGMFASRSISIANASVGSFTNSNSGVSDAIAQMQKLNAESNNKVVDAIGTLRGDFGSLVNAISGMHIRMDSGTVVGELIGKIDSGLGQIATHKGRG